MQRRLAEVALEVGVQQAEAGSQARLSLDRLNNGPVLHRIAVIISYRMLETRCIL